MSDTPNLALPYLEASQAQKHVTLNDALTRIDGLLHLSVLSRGLAAPAVTPVDGDRYLVAAAATGDWVGQSGTIALRAGGAWDFLPPKTGWRLWIADEALFAVFDGSAWVSIGVPDELHNLSLLGVNATADAANKLVVASDNVLLNHAGAGHQLKINKNAAGDTGAVLFQTGYSGRAEFGLAGDDDFHLKVSPDGSAWTEAMVIDATTGAVTLTDHSVSNPALAQMPPRSFKGNALMAEDAVQDLTVPQMHHALNLHGHLLARHFIMS